MSPSMKVFRWILSHLTFIILVLVFMYLYWSWQDDELETTRAGAVASSGESIVKEQTKEKVKETFKEQKQNSRQNTVIVSRQTVSKSDRRSENTFKNDAIRYPETENVHTGKAEPVPDPQAFSERMRQYQLKLSREERERLNSYDKALQARNRAKVMGVKTVPEPVYPDEQIVLNKTAYPGTQGINNRPRVNPVTELRESNRKPATAIVAVPLIEESEPEQKPVAHDKLQKQIRSRQKQLSHQMISLLSATDMPGKSDTSSVNRKEQAVEKRAVKETKHNSPSIPLSVPEVLPVIKTAEQKKLLAEARKAFEQEQYALAEEKYLRLAALLPELPDVMGELANVYRTQKRMTDYVAANSRFVKRLVNHYRFKEAWKVVAETADVDKNAADKQRRIINNRQKQVGTENFIQ